MTSNGMTQVSLPKLKVALALAGVNLTDEELHILEAGYRSDRNGDMVGLVALISPRQT